MADKASTSISGPRRTHCAAQPGAIVLHEVDPAERGKGSGKPSGFWYEVNGDWRRWCQSEGFGVASLKHLHAVDLGDCNVLKITKVAAFDQFASMFGVADRFDRLGEHNAIDWGRVAQTWDGIEIAPYLWSRRLDGGLWYYGWDCASGVIWRPRGARVTYLGPIPAAQEEAVNA